MIPLSRLRERDGVRVGLQKYPLTSLLSPQGEEIRDVQSQKIPKIW